MYLRYIFVGISVFIYYLFQVSVFPSIPYLMVTPNLLLAFTICYALLCGKKAGMLTGLLCGLLWDVLLGSVLGFYTLLFVVIGYVSGMLSDTLSPEDVKFPLLTVFIGDILFGFTVYFVWFLFRRQFQIEYYFWEIIMPETVATSIMTLVVFPITFKIHTKLLKYEKRRSIKFG